MPTEPATSFDVLVLAAVRRILPDVERLHGLARLSGGASQETWCFVAMGRSTTRELILRRAPPGVHPPPHIPGLAVEAAVIGVAGQSGVPVPEVIGTLDSCDGLGDGFLMARVHGETIPRKLLRDAVFASIRPRLAYDLGQILARIHAIDITTLPPLPTRVAATDIDELFAAYFADGQPRPVFEVAFRWLRANAPKTSRRPHLLHGDFRTGNLMIGPDGVTAILDWELAHLGDPAEDLGWLTVNSWRFGTIDKPAGGFGSIDELQRGYHAGGGAVIAESEIADWQTMGTLRWGIMCLGMRARFDSGADRSVERAMIGRRVSETELDLLRLLAPRLTGGT